jgi:putative SOS response-associated peptidase YedK
VAAELREEALSYPLTQWAEAEGPQGRMTKTWYSLQGVDLFAVAGIWRWSKEGGDVY